MSRPAQPAFAAVSLLAAGLVLAAGPLLAQQAPQAPAPAPAPASGKSLKQPARQAANLAPRVEIEPRAVDVLKASSARLAAAKSMSFTAVVSYESPSRFGAPLIYSTKSEVTMQRPDKLRVITPGDGPRSDFYYDGKTMTAIVPQDNLVATASAPATIDAALEAAYRKAAIYFPFSDVLVADPYQDIAAGLKTAFYIGQSSLVGGVKTDMIAYITGDVFVQAWIGTEDKLPYRLYAIYLNDPQRLRHVLALSDWKLDPTLPAGTFEAHPAADAKHIEFARPDTNKRPQMAPPPMKNPSGAK